MIIFQLKVLINQLKTQNIFTLFNTNKRVYA